MTLVIGIRCSDGVVVGADGAATLTTLAEATIRQEITKLHVCRDQIIVGTSGFVGLSQLVVSAIDEVWQSESLHNKKSVQVRTAIRNAMWKHIEPELKAAAIAQNVRGLQNTPLSSICLTLVALPVNKEPCLIQYNPSCASEEATTELPFVAIGSGQFIADPFLAFIRRIFWKRDSLPNVNQGIFAVLWTLSHAIGTNAGGIGDPSQLGVLEKTSHGCKARILTDPDLQEHRVAIQEAEDRLRGLPGAIAEPETPENPAPALPTPTTE